MEQKILIIDFGSQYTRLIARAIRKLKVYCEIHPCTKIPVNFESAKGIIFSGGLDSVFDPDAPNPEFSFLNHDIPVLGVGYGAQYIAKKMGGELIASVRKEYVSTELSFIAVNNPLMKGISSGQQVTMSVSDEIMISEKLMDIIAAFNDMQNVGFQIKGRRIYGVLFHTDDYAKDEDSVLLKNFVFDICKCEPLWTPASFIESAIKEIKNTIGSDNVLLGLSGGVDSSVTAVLMHKAIGRQLNCVFVNNGLLRKNEFATVLNTYKDLGLNVNGVDASAKFLKALHGISDPEQKRKAVGKTFIEVFDDAAHNIPDAHWLAQGTIYPDVIESMPVKGGSASVKSHHNVGGLPDFMKLKIIEPLKSLFKDEVRQVGYELGISPLLINRHPFPGPGLAIRILGEVTAEKVSIVQEADFIFIQTLKEQNWYEKVWQAGAILLPVRSVGSTGGERTYDYVVALRAVGSVDGMTAQWIHLPYDLLELISNRILKEVKGVNRVVYDISSKPPATIEWE
ncbi:MAG: glutamine-hydrolyzing GMP synthase [Bacteroidales bacterium]